MSEELRSTEARIKAVKKLMHEIGPMRPGKISVQYRKPEQRQVPFHQISYTHGGRGGSEYVRDANFQAVLKETENFKHFKELSAELVDLSLKASRLRIKELPKSKSAQN